MKKTLYKKNIYNEYKEIKKQIINEKEKNKLIKNCIIPPPLKMDCKTIIQQNY